MNEIITAIYNDKYYDQMIKNVAGKKHRKLCDDMKQELMIFLMNKPFELIKELYEDGTRIKNYCYRICYLMINSETSPFYCKYRKFENEFEKEIDYEFEIVDEIKEERFDIYEYVTTHKLLDWYEIELFNLYYRFHPSFLEPDLSVKMSYDKIAKLLNIKDRLSINTQMNRIKYKIFKKLLTESEFKDSVFLIEFVAKYESKMKK